MSERQQVLVGAVTQAGCWHHGHWRWLPESSHVAGGAFIHFKVCHNQYSSSAVPCISGLMGFSTKFQATAFKSPGSKSICINLWVTKIKTQCFDCPRFLWFNVDKYCFFFCNYFLMTPSLGSLTDLVRRKKIKVGRQIRRGLQSKACLKRRSWRKWKMSVKGE